MLRSYLNVLFLRRVMMAAASSPQCIYDITGPLTLPIYRWCRQSYMLSIEFTYSWDFLQLFFYVYNIFGNQYTSSKNLSCFSLLSSASVRIGSNGSTQAWIGKNLEVATAFSRHMRYLPGRTENVQDYQNPVSSSYRDTDQSYKPRTSKCDTKMLRR
jgi:hypothetical protein